MRGFSACSHVAACSSNPDGSADVTFLQRRTPFSSGAPRAPGSLTVRILLLSAYDAASHRQWREGLQAYCVEDEFTQLALPARHFSWRVRGNSLSWAFTRRDLLAGDYDVLLATSLVDLSALRGFVPELAGLPTLVYFHENQFAYPVDEGRRVAVEAQLVNLYSALCADRLLFNSHWNRDSFLSGAQALLTRLPDHVPPDLVQGLADKAEVLPVPIGESRAPARMPGERLNVVWNHRWEYDKGPEGLLAAVQQCLGRALPVRFHLLGQQFRRQPAAFDTLAGLLQANPALAGHCGFLSGREQYLAHLASCDVVLSTALQEFQGLAVLEAIGEGCLPLVPDRLSYPEWVPPLLCYPSTPQDPEAEGRAIAARLEQLVASARAGNWPSPPRIEQFGWDVLGPRYRQALARCAEDGLRSARH